jgi:DNA-binding transcriptional LysR family regulator
MQTQLRDVEYFAAIAEHGQVQRAAEALGLSQPALSKSLRRLEQTMNTKLLRRTPKGVELTSVGSALLARVRTLRLSLDDVTREIADLSQGRAGHLRIGSAAGSSLHLVPTACETLLKESPKVTLKITVSDTNAMLTGLRNGELDIVVSLLQGSRHEDLVEEHSHDDAWVIYASASHRLAKRKQLTLADLVHERWAFAAVNSFAERLLSQEFGNRGLPPPIVAIETSNLPTRYHLVAATDLLAVGIRPGVRYASERFPIVELRVKDFALTRRGGVIYRKDAYLSPAAKRFIEILKTTAKEIAAENR